MSIVKSLREIKDPKVSELGGKGYSLTMLINNGFSVPKGFVIVSDAFFEYLKQNNLTEKIEKLTARINEINFREKSKEIKNLILSGEMPKEITLEIKDNLNRLNVLYVSIRSSAVSEDNLKASFAGLHNTFLNVKADLELVLDNIKKCWASLFNERAIIYRIKKNIPLSEGIAVIVQEMIPAEVSGITFTIHPVDKKNLLIEASYGIGNMVVCGKVDPDEYLIDRRTFEIVEKKIGTKDKMTAIRGRKIRILKVEEELGKKQVLPANKIEEITRICLKAEEIFDCSQDVEWCISNNKIFLLQSRPITEMIR